MNATRHGGLGWLPQLHDERDFVYRPRVGKPKPLPSKVDLRDARIPVLDQGQLGSCTAHGAAYVHMHDQLKQGATSLMMPDRLFIYWNERKLEGTIESDAGAFIRDGMKVLNKMGVCSEDLWPYSDDDTRFRQEPPAECYTEALKHRCIEYAAVRHNVEAMRRVLADGYPIIFGFSVYESFESNDVARTGIMPMPAPHERLLGGHCVAHVGYDDKAELFTCVNSWGSGWGAAGFFYMPYKYAASRRCSDHWMARTLEAA